MGDRMMDTSPPDTRLADAEAVAVAEYERAEKWKTRAMCPHANTRWEAEERSTFITTWITECADCGMRWGTAWHPSHNVQALDDDTYDD